MRNTTTLIAPSPDRVAPDKDGPPPTDADVEDAFRSIIRWIGEGPRSRRAA